MKTLRLTHTSLGTKLILGMGLMLLPLIILGISAFFSFQSEISAFQEVAEEGIEELFPLPDLQKLILRATLPAHDYLINGNPAERELFISLSGAIDKAFQEALAAPYGLPQELALIQSARMAWERSRAMMEAVLTLPNPIKDSNTTPQMAIFDAQIDRVLDILDQVYKLGREEISAQQTRQYAVERRLMQTIVLVFVIGLGVAIVTGLLLARSILFPLRVLQEGVSRIGEGDLSHRVTLAMHNELEELGRAFNKMAERLEKNQMQLKDLSIRDCLTGLYNSGEFHRRLKEEIDRSYRNGLSFSLLMLDADDFKVVNDTYGHQAGDEVLRMIATLIKQEVKPPGLVARYGGDEFIAILPEIQGLNALATAKRIHDVVATYKVTVPQGRAINVTISIGVAVFPEDASSGENLIFLADQALYTAKQEPEVRNRVCRAARGIPRKNAAIPGLGGYYRHLV